LLWQASGVVSLRQGWDDEARNWAAFARTPGHDRAHENINLPTLLGLLPAPGRRTLDVACGEGRLTRLLRSRGNQVVGIDASPTMVRLAAEQGSRVLVGDATRPRRGGSGSRCSCTCARSSRPDSPTDRLRAMFHCCGVLGARFARYISTANGSCVAGGNGGVICGWSYLRRATEAGFGTRRRPPV
jgi:SAM-dependent methyltransferase